MPNPYQNLPDKAFWKPSVAEKSMFDVSEIWDPKFCIEKDDKIVTYGSCFAQHIGNALKEREFRWLITEKPPLGLSKENCKKFNYNIFSARTGNIYTTTLLKQWTKWALGKAELPTEIWMKDNRFYDPFRPRIESNGFESPAEARQSLEQTIKCFRNSIKQAQFFVFTLGLTESWINSEFGYEYPMCPGTVAGEFDITKHKFINLNFNQIKTALENSINMMRKINPELKFILTVSPVPLTATYTKQHVLVATMAAKSTLRAVADQLSNDYPYVDYFPSYEIINSPVFKGSFFEPNQRNVNHYGVSFVMESFFRCLVAKFGEKQTKNLNQPKIHNTKKADEVCEEALLEAFGK